MADPLVTAMVVSVGPTLVGLGTFIQARGANRATNHAKKNEPRLVENVVHIREELALVKLDVCDLLTDVTAVKDQSGKVLALAANAVTGIDALKDRTTDLEAVLGIDKDVDVMGRNRTIDRRKP